MSTTNSDGNMRYFLGAQVDVSGLLKNCNGMASLAKLIEQKRQNEQKRGRNAPAPFQPLSEMLSGAELDTIGKHGGVLHKNGEEKELQSKTPRKTAFTPNRVILADGSDDSDQGEILPSKPQQNLQQQQPDGANGDASSVTGIPSKEINLSMVYKHVSISFTRSTRE